MAAIEMHVRDPSSFRAALPVPGVTLTVMAILLVLTKCRGML